MLAMKAFIELDASQRVQRALRARDQADGRVPTRPPGDGLEAATMAGQNMARRPGDGARGERRFKLWVQMRGELRRVPDSSTSGRPP
jgi:hypothetical protein